jgi:AraC-like DNA-binding protein
MIMAKQEPRDIRDQIIAYLEKTLQRKLPWLANQTGISYGHLYFIFKNKKERRKLTEDNLVLINKALGTNFKL